jgi:hypothetical protein
MHLWQWQLTMVCHKSFSVLQYETCFILFSDCWRDTGEKVNVENVLRTFKENVGKVTTIFKHVVPKIAAKSWTKELEAAKALVEGGAM